MLLYVDESVHTGSDLFDAVQRALYYGVNSSDVSLDVLAEARLIFAKVSWRGPAARGAIGGRQGCHHCPRAGKKCRRIRVRAEFIQKRRAT